VFAVVQLTRFTGDRHRDVPQEVRDEALLWLGKHAAPTHYVKLVRAGGDLERAESNRVFGERLPKGLSLV